MSLDQFRQTMAALSPAQLAAVRVVIMAERRIRTGAQGNLPPGVQALDEAYQWALANAEKSA